ncbi:MAG: hypothetical protein GY738_01435, partial [Pseudoalteromonas sp.]|nr:hypothetical protein [Pseudoalteromonas sp.]
IKRHEEREKTTNDGVSRMKKEGNEMTDMTAKQAIREEVIDEDFPSNEEWILTNIETRRKVEWRALVHLQKEIYKAERRERLKEATNPKIFKYGQGKRLEETQKGRTILFREAMKADPDIHYMAIKQGMNLLFTREFNTRMRKQRGKEISEKEYECPMCKIATNKEMMQTKEHWYSGECIISKKLMEQTFNEISLQLGKWNIKHSNKVRILTEIKKEWVEVETRYYEANIENHVKSA